MSALLSLTSHVPRNKKVLVRIDSDVDIKNGKILDDTRLVSALETIRLLLSHKNQVVLIGHLGRPDGIDADLTLAPIAHWFGKVLGEHVTASDESFGGWHIGQQVRLLENIRFFSEEEANDRVFAQELSILGDILVNEAFAVAHRAHASNVGIAAFLPSLAGVHFEQEVRVLSSVLEQPKRPLVVVIGGAKIETKLPMVEKMHGVADFVLVGGEVAAHTKDLIHVQHEKVTNKRSIVLVGDLIESGLDITVQSAENFCEVLDTAKTIVWNGPVGQTGKDPVTELATRIIAHTMANSHAYTIVGGGDTLSYLKQHRLLDKFSFVSVGGGAMLEFLSGNELPAISVLLKR
jgi:3-phosphoglycerate kinase